MCTAKHNNDCTVPAPPPYGLAVLLALAQQQYHYFSRQASLPAPYMVIQKIYLML
jgi:hypothetical protein